MGFWKPEPAKVTGQIQQFTPEQQQLQSAGITRALNMLQNPNKFDFAPIAAEARKNFQTQTIPMLAERFQALGGPNTQGAQRSSGYLGTLGAAGAGLESSLAALQSQFGLQQQGQENLLLNYLLSFGLQPNFQPIVRQAESSGVSQIGNSIGKALQTAPAMLAMGAGPAGAAAGAGAAGLASLLPWLFQLFGAR